MGVVDDDAESRGLTPPATHSKRPGTWGTVPSARRCSPVLQPSSAKVSATSTAFAMLKRPASGRSIRCPTRGTDCPWPDVLHVDMCGVDRAHRDRRDSASRRP